MSEVERSKKLIPLEQRAEQFLSRFGKGVVDLRREKSLSYAAFVCDQSPENKSRHTEANRKLNDYLVSENCYKDLREIWTSPGFHQLDRALRRQFSGELVYSSPSQLRELPLLQTIASQKTELTDLYDKGPDRKHVATYTYVDSDGQERYFLDSFLDLVQNRNKLARMRGYDNFYYLKMDEFEIDRNERRKIHDALTDAYAAFADRWNLFQVKEYALSLFDAGVMDKDTLHNLEGKDISEYLEAFSYIDDQDQMKVWGDLVTKSEQDVTLDVIKEHNLFDLRRQELKMMGLSVEDFDDLVDTGNFYKREGKTKQAQYILVDRDTIRIVCNLPLTDAELEREDVRCFNHETGHGMHAKMLDPQLPALLRRHNGIVDEGMANIFQSTMNSNEYMHQVLNMNSKEIKEAEMQIKRINLEKVFSHSQIYLCYSEFEQRMYEDPQQDMEQLYMDVREKIIKKDQKKKSWFLPHYLGLEVSIDKYIFANLWAAQVRAYAQNHFGGLLNPQFGEWIRMHRSTGFLYTMEEGLINMTGEGLNPQYYIDEVDTMISDLEQDLDQRVEEALHGKNKKKEKGIFRNVFNRISSPAAR